MTNTTTQASFGAGCFWGVEEAFRTLPGVIKTTVGYAGGTLENPSYEAVCTGQTHHAEVVQVDYNPVLISYDQLLEVFWKSHDPTQLNRQGPDTGTQYRSVIFTHDDTQQHLATESKAQLNQSGKLSKPVVTEILPAPTFYPAEEYHQQYFAKRGGGVCHV